MLKINQIATICKIDAIEQVHVCPIEDLSAIRTLVFPLVAIDIVNYTLKNNMQFAKYRIYVLDNQKNNVNPLHIIEGCTLLAVEIAEKLGVSSATFYPLLEKTANLLAGVYYDIELPFIDCINT